MLKNKLLCGGLFVLLWLGLGRLPAAAVHLLGGEMSYQYLDANGPSGKPWRYKITVRLYYNPVTDPQDNRIGIRIRPTYSQIGTALVQEIVARKSGTPVSPALLPGCSQVLPAVALGLYEVVVSLPALNGDDYEAWCDTNNRVAGITNIQESAKTGMALHVIMKAPAVQNSAPVFSTVPVAFVCLGTANAVPNTAYDADGDQLVYRPGTPQTSYQVVPYAAGYSASQPFGATGAFSIDPVSGISTYRSMEQGVFQVAIDVDEFRVINGQRTLLGTTHRDVQVVVRACSGPPGQLPYFTPASLAQTSFEVPAGQDLAFDVTAVDPDGHPLTLTASSALLDGPGGIAASFANLPGSSIAANPAGQASVRATGSATGTFRLSGCVPDRATPYEVLLTATDEVCNSQTIAALFRIRVVRPAFAGAVQGKAAVCAQSTATYTVTSTPAYGAYEWTVTGGELLAPSSGPTATVLWSREGTGVVRAAGIGPRGCPTQAAVFAVNIGYGLPLTGPTEYCPTEATGLRYSMSTAPAAYQWTITNGLITSGQHTNEVVVDVHPGATALLEVSLPGLPGCRSTVRIAPRDTCVAFYNVITPNGDGQNEVFTVRNVQYYPGTALTVFDRWGRQVYHSDDYRNTYGGAGTGPGVHYYRCVLANGTAYKGWFDIIR